MFEVSESYSFRNALFKNWNKSVVKEYHIGLFCGETYGYGICGRLGFRIQLIVPTQFERKMYPASCKKCSGISSRAVNGRRLSAFVQISGLFQIYITDICTIYKKAIWSKEKGWEDLVDCPTQLICTWIFICCLCSMTKLKEHSRENC